MNNLTEWIKSELKPSIFRNADKVFPELAFKAVSGKGWKSSKDLDGNTPITFQADKIVFFRVSGVLENGAQMRHEDSIDLYKRLNNISNNMEAYKALAELLGLEVPNDRDPEALRKWEEYKTKQNKLEASLARQQNALHSTAEGNKVLTYLQEERGYTMDFINWVGFGYVSPKERLTIAELLGENPPQGRSREDFFTWASNTFPLSIPCRSKGNIYSFKFRTTAKPQPKDGIEPSAEAKPKKKTQKYYNIGGVEKSKFLFGLNELSLSEKDKNSRNLIVVEGELDCLRMQYNGFNAVASLGGEISKDSLLEAKSKGVKYLTLLYDSDKGGRNFTERTIKTASSIGLKVLVAELPSGEDPDSFFRTHSKEEMKELLDSADKGGFFLFVNCLEAFSKEPEITEVSLLDLQETTIDIASNYAMDEVERDQIFNFFSQSFPQAQINTDSLRKIADRKIDEANRISQEKATKELVSKANVLLDKGNLDEALELLKEEPQRILGKRNASEFSSLLRPIRKKDFLKSIREEGDPLNTSYVLSWQNGEQVGEQTITIPVGAITLVCAPTGHGKSTLLRNFVLDILEQDDSEGDILYFTYEESNNDLICQFTNTYHGKLIHTPSKTHKQIDAIRHYYKTGVPKFFIGCNEGKETSQQAKDFINSYEEFFNKYLETGRLKLYYKDYDITTLLNALQYCYDNTPKIKAVFIDYVQLLRKTGSRLTRQDELQEISNSISAFAVKTKLPVIMACQLNREATTPLRMTNQNISESSYLEKSANTILCCWNSKYKAPFGKNNVNEQSQEGKELTSLKETNQFELGVPGKMFIKMTKRRGGTSEIYGVFDFEQAIGKIYSSSKDDPKETEKSKGISEEERREYNLDSFTKKPLPSNEEDVLPF